jgi:hypothetical protein
MLVAVHKRELAVEQALDQYAINVHQQLAMRHSTLLQGWAIMDLNKRRLALKAIWRQFGMTWRTEEQKMNLAKRQAWEVYRSDRSDCGLSGLDEDAGGFGADAQ